MPTAASCEHVVEPEDPHVRAPRGARFGPAATPGPHLRDVSRPLVHARRATFGRPAERPRRRGARLRRAGMTRTNNVVIAHEILHTLGATGQIRSPASRRCSRADTLSRSSSRCYPQTFTEIMAGRYAVDAHTFEMPASLADVVVGEATAHEIRWITHERTCWRPRSCASPCQGARSWINSTAAFAPANSSHCWAATAPASPCCCARWRDCARQRRARATRWPRHRDHRAPRGRQANGVPAAGSRCGAQGSLLESVLLGRFAHLGFWETDGAADEHG